MKKLLLLLVITVAVISCESKSARYNRMGTTPTPTIITEKVVIMDSAKGLPMYRNGNNYYTYKVNRITKGVVSYVTVPGLYEPNDTILVKLVNFTQ